MRNYLLALAFSALPLLAQAPSVSPGGIVNHFSYALPGMPNASIAQGSIFDVYGSNIGPVTLTQAQGFPLPTAISGSSVQVTMGSTTVDVLLFYVAQNQIVGLLPSRTPTGAGTLTVTRNGVRTAPQPIIVTSRNLGILTLAQNGQGAAVMQIPDSSGNAPLNSLTNSIRPNQVGVFYGTGLGPVPFDESRAAPLLNLDPPLQAFVGGVPARVLFQGRAPGFAGLDQINLEVPPGVTGCYVTVYFKYGNVISNLTTISIAPTSACPDPNVSSGDNPGPGTGTLRVAGVNLVRSSFIFPASILAPATEILTDSGAAAFSLIDLSKIPPSTQTPVLTQIGNCIVGPIVNQVPSEPNNSVTYLNGGPSFTIRGPNGLKQLEKFSVGFGATLGGTPYPGLVPVPPPPYLVPGVYTVDNGGGSADVPGFTASITIPAPPFAWTNATTAAQPPAILSRSEGFEITWSGGDSTGFVDIAGTSNLPRSATQPVASGGYFSCRAAASLGRFRITPDILLFLPPSVVQNGVPSGVLTVSQTQTSVPLPLPGFTTPLLNAGVGITRSVQFQ